MGAKFHLDPSSRLATIHQRYRQTDRQTDRHTDRQTDRTGQTDRQRSDSKGRTVLQTVAQKSKLFWFIILANVVVREYRCVSMCADWVKPCVWLRLHADSPATGLCRRRRSKPRRQRRQHAAHICSTSRYSRLTRNVTRIATKGLQSHKIPLFNRDCLSPMVTSHLRR